MKTLCANYDSKEFPIQRTKQRDQSKADEVWYTDSSKTETGT